MGALVPVYLNFSITATPTVAMSLSMYTLYCNVSAFHLDVTPIERQYFGRTVKIPGDIVFGDLTTTIINTEDLMLEMN